MVAIVCGVMQNKSSTIVIYAAGASLAAITLAYVLGPTVFPAYIHDGDSDVPKKTSNNGVVGLSNPANDCYINSVLQALAGSNKFRIFVEREVYRRRSYGLEVWMIAETLWLDG